MIKKLREAYDFITKGIKKHSLTIKNIMFFLVPCLITVRCFLYVESEFVNNNSIIFLGFFVDLFLYPLTARAGHGVQFWVALQTVFNMCGILLIVSILSLLIYLIFRYIFKKKTKYTSIMLLLEILVLIIMLL